MTKVQSKVAEFLSEQIDGSGKTQLELANEIGFPRSNVISMVKSGVTKLPIPRIPATAKALDLDPMKLFRMCMEEYQPDILAVTDEVYKHEELSTGEREIIDTVRLHLSGKKPTRLSAKAKELLDDLAKQIVQDSSRSRPPKK